MPDNMTHDLYLPVFQEVALDTVPLKNGHSSQNLDEEPMFIVFL